MADNVTVCKDCGQTCCLYGLPCRLWPRETEEGFGYPSCANATDELKSIAEGKD